MATPDLTADSMVKRYINEGWLKGEIENVWGPAGAHSDIYRALLAHRERLMILARRVAENEHLGTELRQAAEEAMEPWQR